MNHFLKGVALSLVLSTASYAGKIKEDFKTYKIPSLVEVSFEDEDFLKDKKEWTKLKRKLASDMSFSGSDMSSDLQKLRDEWLKVKTGSEMEELLKKSHADFNKYSEDTKYFLAQIHTALPFRGIIWKLRPLFENSSGFLGNKSTHVTAIQAVRGSVSALKMFLPTKQTDAAIQFFTEPSIEMTKDDQFKTVGQFQKYLMENFMPVLNESISRIQLVTKNSAQKVFVWDNKMVFGRGTFDDDIQRFVGNGPAEMNFVLASMYRASHDILIYCAYNQEYSIKLAGEMGSHLGIDSSVFASKREDIGMTDKERVSLIKSATSKHNFLEIRNYSGSRYGSELMKQAYSSLKSSVVYAERSYEYLQGRDTSRSMGLNPVLFQPEISPNLDKGIKNMKAVVNGPAEVRDPVSGETVTINLPAFYNEPPESLNVLMPVGFEEGEVQKSIKNKKGEYLQVRNYLHGRSISWNNMAWRKYVPSAEGKNAGYMADARRAIRSSFGTSIIFGLPDLFVH